VLSDEDESVVRKSRGKKRRVIESSEVPEELTQDRRTTSVADIGAEMIRCAAKTMRVADTSNNLKGTYVKLLGCGELHHRGRNRTRKEGSYRLWRRDFGVCGRRSGVGGGESGSSGRNLKTGLLRTPGLPTVRRLYLRRRTNRRMADFASHRTGEENRGAGLPS
jgi:hypothetical protein